MGVFSDLDIERQEAEAFVRLPAADLQEVDEALSSLVDLGRKIALVRLNSAARAIARTTGTLNHLLEGPMYSAPVVRAGEDAESVVVGFLRARSRAVKILAKHLARAKGKNWPAALNDEVAGAAVDAVRGEVAATGAWGEGPTSRVLDALIDDDRRRSALEGVD